MVLLAGLDEAGRGPVLGPMVLAIACADSECQQELKEMGVKDSKLLTRERREELFSEIKDMCNNDIIVVSPAEIDGAIGGSSSNLNWLEADHFAMLSDKMKPEQLVIDCPSINPAGFELYFRKKLTHVPDVMTIVHKADVDFPIVGAASILAKVTRDREIDKIKEEYGIECGSGYATDPHTINFLKDNWNKYPIFRKSWSTWKKARESSMQQKLEF